MTLSQALRHRLTFLCRVVQREHVHLLQTDSRLFIDGFGPQSLRTLDQEPVLAERLEAFVSRFSRLQDTLGDKLLPVLLTALSESVGSAADNLDRAEKLGLLMSADHWFSLRLLRNQMVHEYIEDQQILWDAIHSAHLGLPHLTHATQAMLQQATRRGAPP